VSSFKRTAAVWVLRQAARRVAEETARRRQSGAGAGSAYRPAGSGTSWANAAGPRVEALRPRVEELVRRAWPLVDTPANRERAIRFVERMRSVANTPR
jgi:hypothetical protein